MPADTFTLFAEHGLAGLVISVLFFMIFYLLRCLTSKDDKFAQHIQEILDDDREERKEAREDNKESHKRLAEAIDGLADGLRDSKSD